MSVPAKMLQTDLYISFLPPYRHDRRNTDRIFDNYRDAVHRIIAA